MDFCLQRRTSIPANSTVNVIAGDQFEYVDKDSLLDFGFVAETANALLVDILLTDRTVARQLTPTSKAAGTMPVVPDDFPIRKTEGFAGERIVMSVQNTTAGAVVLNWAVCIHG